MENNYLCAKTNSKRAKKAFAFPKRIAGWFRSRCPSWKEEGFFWFARQTKAIAFAAMGQRIFKPESLHGAQITVHSLNAQHDIYPGKSRTNPEPSHYVFFTAATSLTLRNHGTKAGCFEACGRAQTRNRLHQNIQSVGPEGDKHIKTKLSEIIF